MRDCQDDADNGALTSTVAPSMRMASLIRAPAATLTLGPASRMYRLDTETMEDADPALYCRVGCHSPSETFGPILALSSTSAEASIYTGAMIVGPPLPGLPGAVNNFELIFWKCER